MRRNILTLSGVALAMLLALPVAPAATAATKACPKGHKTMMVHGKLVKCAVVKAKAKVTAKPTPSATASNEVPPLGTVVTIAGFGFSRVSVKAGSTVTVRNTSSVEHTLTIATAGIDVDVPGGGGTATFTAPSQPGTYALTCDFHLSMKGALVVVA